MFSCFEGHRHAGELEEIHRVVHGPVEETVVRWCPTCGAVVIDTDSDNHTNPGAVKPMRFPQIVYSAHLIQQMGL